MSMSASGDNLASLANADPPSTSSDTTPDASSPNLEKTVVSTSASPSQSAIPKAINRAHASPSKTSNANGSTVCASKTNSPALVKKSAVSSPKGKSGKTPSTTSQSHTCSSGKKEKSHVSGSSQQSTSKNTSQSNNSTSASSSNAALLSSIASDSRRASNSSIGGDSKISISSLSTSSGLGSMSASASSSLSASMSTSASSTCSGMTASSASSSVTSPKPSQLPRSPDDGAPGTSCSSSAPVFTFHEVRYKDGGAHWYRSSAVLLCFHKWFNPSSPDDPCKPPEVQSNLIISDAGLRIVELRSLPEGVVFHHWEFLNDRPPTIFRLKYSEIKSLASPTMLEFTVLAEDCFGNVVKKKMSMAEISQFDPSNPTSPETLAEVMVAET